MTSPGRFQPSLTTGPAWDSLLGGRSRREFCRRTRVERESLSRWARGESEPREGSIAQIAAALGRDAGEIRALLVQIVAEGRARRERAATEAAQ
jgi:transcriptional regulator with XRE-family HTH domain